MVEVVRSYNTDCSTIGTVPKNKAKIMKHVKSCAKDANNNIEAAWKNDGGNRKTPQCVDAGISISTESHSA